MRAAIAGHFAWRVARLRTLFLCAALPLLWAALGGGGNGSTGAPVDAAAATRDLGRAAWVSLAAAVLLIAAAAGASAGAAHRRRDHAWLGRSGATLGATFAWAFVGLAAGLAALVTAGSLSHALAFPGATDPLELSATAGPGGSIRLLPGESLGQSLTEVPRRGPSRIRMRLVPTVGGQAPTTTVELSFTGGGPSKPTPVARRTWVEAPWPKGSGQVTLTNTGQGALALLGPRGIEVWTERAPVLGGLPTTALRLLMAGLWAMALAFGLSTWMGPGIAGLLALSLLVAGGSAHSLAPLRALGEALGALAEGRLARGVTPVEGLALAGVAAAGILLFTAGAARGEVEP